MFKMKFIVLCISLLLVQQSSAQCGRRKTSRIVGGTNTGVNEFTMMAGLVQAPSPVVFCGATILANYFVLTSAHCVQTRALTNLYVLVGDYNYNSATETPYAAVYKVAFKIIHPSFNPTTNVADIAILQLATPIVYNVAVGPVCLPPNSLFTNSAVEVVGWGSTSFGGPLSSTLKKATVTVISNSQCNPYYNGKIQDTEICTLATGRDSCQEDSGGPVYLTINGRVNIVGIITAGVGCANNIPSINTRVSSYVTWIKQNTPGAVYF